MGTMFKRKLSDERPAFGGGLGSGDAGADDAPFSLGNGERSSFGGDGGDPDRDPLLGSQDLTYARRPTVDELKYQHAARNATGARRLQVGGGRM